MASPLDRLRLLGRADEWTRVGRFEVNRRTGERRAIPGLELGVLAEDVNAESSWRLPSLKDAGADLLQGIADLPGVVAEGAAYAAQNQPAALAGAYLSGKLTEAAGLKGGSFAEQRAAQQKFTDDLLDPYRRAKEGISDPLPEFTEAPLEATVRGGLRSLPETLGIALTGGAGAVASGANQANQSYEEMRARGVPDYIAIPASAGVGTIQGALDRIGAEGALKGLTGGVSRLFKGAAFEGVTEATQEAVGIAGESLTGKEQELAKVRERLGVALSSGMLVGGGLGSASRVAGINVPGDPELPVVQQQAQAIEERLFPARRTADYLKIASEGGIRKAAARRLNDLSLQMDEDLKWEMLLDDQTDLALGREWQKIKERVDADPEMAIVDVDLDGVKAGNDALGHDAADQLIFRPSTDALHQVAEQYGISKRLRIRKGGDEFRIVVPKEAAAQFAQDLQAAIPPRFIPLPPEAAAKAGMPDGAYIQHGASIGWGQTSNEADQSMYRAKQAKPNRGALSPGQPPFVSQAQAEQQVINHTAPQQVEPPPQAAPQAQPGATPPLSTREALAGTGALFIAPTELVNTATEGARGLLKKVVGARQKWATAEGNLPIPWMQAHERQVQGQRAAKLATDFIAQDYGKALAQEIRNGALPEEINHRAKQYLSGDKEVQIPEPMKPILDRMRAYYDTDISQALVDSGVARDPAHVKTILENQGEYIYRAFKMHIQPDWAKKMVGTPTFEKAVDYTISKEDSRLQSILDSRNQLAQEYEQKLAEVDAELQGVLAPGSPGDVVPYGLWQEAGRMNRDARQGARETAREEKLALREQYAKKLGIARSRAAWAEKKIAANAINQNRRAEVAGKVEETITYDPRAVNSGGFKGLSKAWMAKRKGIPQEYLDVMGEIDDPVTGLVMVAERAARSMGRKAMWDDIVMGSLGKDVFTQEMPGHVHKIEGVKIPGPSGEEIELYTSKELHDAVTEAFETGHQSVGFWDMLNGGLKANATIFNPQGAMRNLQSGLIPLFANGNLLPGMIKHGASSVRTAMANAGWGNKEFRQEALEAVRYGVLGTTVDSRDAAKYFEAIVETPGQQGVGRKVFNFAQKAYAWGDNFAKLVAWKAERDRYAEAYGLPRDSPEVMTRAAEVVKRTIQNYDRLPKWAKEVRKSPVIGPFVSFPASVISNVGGVYQTVAEDLKSENPKIRQAGRVRAAYALGTLGGIVFGESMARFFKDDEEDDVAVIDDVRPMLPPWMQNSSLMLWDKAPGSAQVVDMSFLNYYDTITRPLQMLLRGDFEDSPGQVAMETAWETGKKIFGEELALQAYADLTRGPANGGPEILNDKMQPDVALWRIARYALRSMAPGAVRTAARIIEAEPGKRGTELVALLGPRVTTVNIPKALDYSLYELQSDRAAIRTSLQGALKSTALLALPEFESNVQGFAPSLESIYSQALSNYQAAVRRGVPPQEARASMGEKMYKAGKLMVASLNLGASPEVAVQKAVEYEWRGLKPDLLDQVKAKQKLALADYVHAYPDATALAVERRRLELEDWARKATSIINAAGGAPDPLARLRQLGATP